MLRSVGAPRSPALGTSLKLGRAQARSVAALSTAQEASVARRKSVGLARGTERDVLRGPLAHAADGTEPRDRLFRRAERLQHERILQRSLPQRAQRLNARPPQPHLSQIRARNLRRAPKR